MKKISSLLIILILTSCSVSNSNEVLSESSSSISSQMSSTSSENLRIDRDCFYLDKGDILNNEDRDYWTNQFPILFPDIISSKSFDSLLTISRGCKIDKLNKLIAFVYSEREQSQIPQTDYPPHHTIIGLFNEKNILLNYTDVSCEHIDDIGGAQFIDESENYLLIKCASGGALRARFQYIAINLDDFTQQSIMRKTCNWVDLGYDSAMNIPNKFIPKIHCD